MSTSLTIAEKYKPRTSTVGGGLRGRQTYSGVSPLNTEMG